MTTTWTATRRGVLGRGVALAGAVGLGAPLAASAATRAGGRRRPPIDHIVIDCQENRSFDHYYGFAPFVGVARRPGRVLAARRQRLAASRRSRSRARPRPTSATPGATIHSEWNGGAMDGFFTTDGIDCMGYYTEHACRSTTGCTTTSRCA